MFEALFSVVGVVAVRIFAVVDVDVAVVVTLGGVSGKGARGASNGLVYSSRAASIYVGASIFLMQSSVDANFSFSIVFVCLLAILNSFFLLSSCLGVVIVCTFFPLSW